MPSDVAPLCPTCFDRVPSWTAAACPSCGKSSPIAACDDCLKSRSGAFVPDDAKKTDASGGAQRFLCVDCMERTLEREVSERMRDAILAVALAVVAVYYTNALFVFISALVAAAAVCLLFWWVATRNRRDPARHAKSIWNLFRRRIDRAVKRREREQARRT